MALVRMKEKFQLTVPVKLRQRLQLNVGDLFEAKIDKDETLVFTPKMVVDRKPSKKAA